MTRKPRRQRTSKMRLNFTVNSFVSGRKKSWNCAQNFFHKACKAKTSKIRLNFTVNSFVFGRTNRGIAPTSLSVKLAGRELPKCV